MLAQAAEEADLVVSDDGDSEDELESRKEAEDRKRKVVAARRQLQQLIAVPLTTTAYSGSPSTTENSFQSFIVHYASVESPVLGILGFAVLLLMLKECL